jgi:hypothetical protein
MRTEPMITLRQCQRMFGRLTCVAVATSAAILSACASTRPPGVWDFDDRPPNREGPVDTATYRFSFSVHALRRVEVSGRFTSNYENYERDIVGVISMGETRVLALQTGERLLEGAEPCRIDVARQLEDRDSELEVQCADVRLKLHQVNGRIVDGTGFAWVRTDQGSEACISPIGRNGCLLRQRQGRANMVTEYAWRSGSLRVERVAEPGGDVANTRGLEPGDVTSADQLRELRAGSR